MSVTDMSLSDLLVALSHDDMDSDDAWDELLRRDAAKDARIGELENSYEALSEQLIAQSEEVSEDRRRLTKTLRLDDSHGPAPASMDFIVASIDAVVRQAGGPRARLMSEPMVQCETDRLRAKLKTLEAAVRAVRDDELIEWCDPDERVKELFALVPEATTRDGGGS